MHIFYLKGVSDRCIVLKMNPFLSTDTLNNILNIPNLRGVVMETYGFGQITTKNLKLMEILQENIQKKSKFQKKFIIIIFSCRFDNN